jgi:hypothetical protein
MAERLRGHVDGTSTQHSIHLPLSGWMLPADRPPRLGAVSPYPHRSAATSPPRSPYSRGSAAASSHPIYASPPFARRAWRRIPHRAPSRPIRLDPQIPAARPPAARPASNVVPPSSPPRPRARRRPARDDSKRPPRSPSWRRPAATSTSLAPCTSRCAERPMATPGSTSSPPRARAPIRRPTALSLHGLTASVSGASLTTASPPHRGCARRPGAGGAGRAPRLPRPSSPGSSRGPRRCASR